MKLQVLLQILQFIRDHWLLILFIGAVLFGLITLIGTREVRKKNTDWEAVKKAKWEALQPRIKRMNELYYNSIGIGGKIKLTKKKAAKEDYETIKQDVYEFKQFCEDKRLSLPDEFGETEELTLATDYALQHPHRALNKELERVQNQYAKVYELVVATEKELFTKRQKSIALIEKIENLINSIANQPKTFQKEFEEISIQRTKFQDAIAYAEKEAATMRASAIGAASGVVVGAAVATVAPSAAVWAVTTFGTASTGTAISSLSGAALTNAAMAALGGGSIAAGGGGVAAGEALLALAGPVGWAIAGVSLATCIAITWHSMAKNQEEKRDEIINILNCKEMLMESKGKIEGFIIQTDTLSTLLQDSYQNLSYLEGFEYSTIPLNKRYALGSLVNSTKSISALLNQTLESEKPDK